MKPRELAEAAETIERLSFELHDALCSNAEQHGELVRLSLDTLKAANKVARRVRKLFPDVGTEGDNG